MDIRVGEHLLRPPRRTDLAAVVGACSDPEIPRFIPFIPLPYTEQAGQAWLARCEREWRGTKERTFAIVERGSDWLIGAVTVRLREGGLIGFWLSREARGRGVMTKAVKAVLEWAGSEHRIERLCIVTHPDNVAAQRVVEKAGFVRVGFASHEPPFRDGTSRVIQFELRLNSLQAARCSSEVMPAILQRDE